MKVKKVLSGIMATILILVGNMVYATSESTLTVESVEKAKSGDEISVNLKLNVTSSEEGVDGIIADIEYPTEILTMVTPESSEVIVMDGILMIVLDEPVKEGEKVITIKFIVNNNLQETEATIKIKDIIITSVDETAQDIGTKEVTIKINEEETSGEDEDLTEKKLSNIEITKAPNKTEYTEGENFDKTGMTVTAIYSDGTTNEVTNYTCSPEENVGKEDKKVTISYTEDGVTKTAEIEITVKEKMDKVENKEEEEKTPTKNPPKVESDGTETNKKIPNTGVEKLIIPIVVLAIFGVVSYVGYKKYRNI